MVVSIRENGNNINMKGGGSDTSAPAPRVNPTPIGGYYVTNPPFDRRIGTRGAVDKNGKFITTTRSAVRRGYMVTDKPGSNGKRYMVNFQYNPTSFSHAASVQAEIPYLHPTGDDGGSGQGSGVMAFIADSGQSVDFSLLFDRTYETWESTGGGAANRMGCLADVKTLYAMLGMYYSSVPEFGGGAVEDAIDNVNFSPTGVLTPVPLWIYFGQYVQFYGLIQSVNVNFTHFTQKMVPVRCAVNLNMTVLPRPTSADTTDIYYRSPEAYAKMRAQQDKRISGKKGGVI